MPNPILYDFTVPDDLRKARKDRGIDLPAKIALRELSANDELQIASVARGSGAYQKARYDGAKRAIAEIDGKPVSYADAEIDQFWENCGPQLRELILESFEEFSAPTEDQRNDFRKSRKDRLA